jgi:flagellar biosynthesis anti-sigma factor FlgM
MQKKPSSPRQPNFPPGTDSVHLSEKSREILKIKNLLHAVPDIRENIVTEIRTKIEEGNYEIDSDKIAVSIIKESLLHDIEQIIQSEFSIL